MSGSIQDFNQVLGKLAVFVQFSGKVGGDVKSQADLTKKAFDTQNNFLKAASGKAKPAEAELCTLLKPTSDGIAAVQDFKTKHPTSAQSHHLSSVSEAIAALGWVAQAPPSNPGEMVKQTIESTKFYTNRVLKDFKKDNPVHGEWVNSLLEVLKELESFVKKNHARGLVWGQ